jgi:hypothetical protein
MRLLDLQESMIVFSRRVQTGLQILKVSLHRWEHLQNDPMPWRVWAVATLQAPDGQGFPIQSERDMLDVAEADLLSRIPDDGNTICLGSITHRGQHVVILHSKYHNVLGEPPTSRVRGQQYRWDVYTEEDPEYNFLHVKLIPNAKEQRRIRDAEVLAALAAAGDREEVPRPLTFYGLFEHQEWADAAAQELAAAGFRPSPASALPGNSRTPWSLMFQRSSPTDQQSIESISASAQEILNQCGGYYDGWTCEPVS